MKSLVFVDAETNRLVLLLVSGAHNADVAFIAATYGLRLKRADIDRVREETGFAIGGVGPIGHQVALPVFLDESLLAHEVVWCAAGRPDSIFSCDPSVLGEKIAATVIRVRRRDRRAYRFCVPAGCGLATAKGLVSPCCGTSR